VFQVIKTKGFEMRITRRDALSYSSAALAGVGLASASGLFAATEKPTDKKFKKAVKIGMVRAGETLLDKFKLLKELGFDGVELDAPSRVIVEEAKRAIGETGLQVPGVVDSVHWNQRLSDPSEEVRAKGLEALRAALQFCKDIGGTSVLLVPGRVTPDATYEQAWERSLAEINKAIPTAQSLGIQILLENVWNDFLIDPQETARYIDACGSPLVGAHFDIGNTVRYSPPHEWIPILGARIKKLDIKDYKRPADSGNLGDGFQAKLLEGDVDWPRCMAELRKIGYAGWGCAEIQGGDRVWLTDVAARMDKIFAS
jgi:L-ribulose-5-phosphate 3-epimerase